MKLEKYNKPIDLDLLKHVSSDYGYGYETIVEAGLFDNVEGYIKVGVAKDVQFTLTAESEIKAAKIASLKQRKAKTQADAEQKCLQIDEEIQKLMALETTTQAKPATSSPSWPKPPIPPQG